MNFIKALWARFLALFNKSEQPEIVNTPESRPTADKPAPKQTTEDNSVVERPDRLERARDAIARHAEEYERNQDRLVEDAIDPNGDPVPEFVEAAYLVDWLAVARGYRDSTIHRILGSGTNLNFKGHDDLRKAIMAAARTESAKRAPEPAKHHGMGQDGGQK